MLDRSDTQNSGRGRPFSTTNPFRSAANVDVGVNQYGNDRQFQDWASSQMRGTSSHSSFSTPYEADEMFGRNIASPAESAFSGNMSPKGVKPASTNPFLDDVEERPASPPRQTNTRPRPVHSSSTDEKERLRQRYLQVDNEQTVKPVSSTLPPPPSYEEAAGPKKSKGKYPSEKEHSHRHRSERERDRHPRHRHRSDHNSSHNKASTSSPSKKDKRKSKVSMPKNVDTIDKLDVTGLFGGSFHHDGPFDACTPHRNKGNKVAPVMAFPADGPNSTIGGASAKKSALNEVFGREDDDEDDGLYKLRNDTKDAIRGNVGNVKQMDIKNKTELVHGPTTAGLGSTTFLDGAPAAGNTSNNINRNKSVSYKFREENAHKFDNLRRNMSTNSHAPTRHRTGSTEGYPPRYNSSSSSIQRSRNPERISTTKSGGSGTGHITFGDDEDDIYLGLPQQTKKKSAGSKLLNRVKSLKVGGRKN